MAVDRIDQLVGGIAMKLIKARRTTHREHWSYSVGRLVGPAGMLPLRRGGALDPVGVDGTQKDGEHGNRDGQQPQRNHQDYGHG